MRRPSYFYTVKDRRAKTLSPVALAKLQTSEQTKEGMAEIARLQKAGGDIRPGKEMLSVVTWGARYEEGTQTTACRTPSSASRRRLARM